MLCNVDRAEIGVLTMPQSRFRASAAPFHEERNLCLRSGRIALEPKSGEIFLGEMTAQQIVKKAAQRDFPRHK
jgi:hypothetical protein